ncbi:MAG: hypothetical protein GY832_40420 [Chloroflexi bacterium]|nr:hypothetical protein [Chloroflexota bacterium]
MGGLATPDTLIVDKATGRTLTREIADKQVTTVLLDHGTEEQPTSETMRRASVLSDKQAAKLVELGMQIETLYGMPMDIEWTLTDGAFAIVQVRPITTLPDPEPPIPTEWKLPKGMYSAMRNNIVELMIDPLTSLFDTLGRAAINVSYNRLLTSFFGRPDCMPEEIIISVNKYAYYNGSLTLGQIARIFWGSVAMIKYMSTGAVERWTEAGRPRYAAIVARWQATPWRELPSTELLNATRQLTEATIDAYGALVSGVLPGAWVTEALFTFTYKTLIKRRNDPIPSTYLMGFNSIPIQAEKPLYDLAEWVRTRAELAVYLSNTSTVQLTVQLDSDQMPPDMNADDWQQWQTHFQAHLQQYGHAIYNLDFSNPVPVDDPAPILATLKLFLNDQGVNPHTRQQASAERREQATQATQNRLKGLRLKLFRKVITMAQRYAPLREDGLADIGLSYPLLRQMLRELGRRFVEGGMIEQPDDVFWLNQTEVERAANRLDHNEASDCLSATIPQRKAAWRDARRVTPPMMLPQIKFLGVDIGELEARKGKGGKGRCAQRCRRQPRHCDLPGPRPARSGGLWSDADGRCARGSTHHPGLDAIVRPSVGHCH